MAYAKALEEITGVSMTKMLPIPRIENSKFPDTKWFEEQGMRHRLYHFSLTDYKNLAATWRRPHPSGDGDVEVISGTPERQRAIRRSTCPRSRPTARRAMIRVN